MAAPTEFNVIQAFRSYLTRILKPKDAKYQVTGMKCLLLDKETKQMVSMAYSMNDILAKEVYMVESLEAAPASVGHMKAIVVARPTHDTIKQLVAHLQEPKFLEYHLFFTNFLSSDLLRKLADADRLGVVKQVQEFYADYYAVNPDTFSFYLPGSLGLCRPRTYWGHPEESNLKRCTQGLLSVLLSLKVKPYIRHLANSEAASALAREVAQSLSGESQLFTFNKSGGAPLLIILDRKEDAVTPLLNQWTYQAMVHELLPGKPGGLCQNRVDLRAAAEVKEEFKEIVLSPTDDSFFAQNMYANYGDLAEAIKTQLDDFTRLKTSAAPTANMSIEDMAKFVDKYPELSSKGFVVGKHVAIMNELQSAVERGNLFDLSELEQNLAGPVDSPNDHARDIQAFLTAGGAPVDPLHALRLVMLYALRYERSRPDKVAELRRFAGERFEMRNTLSLVSDLTTLAGAGARSMDLFNTGAGAGGGGGGLLSVMRSAVAQAARSVEGVKNVFSQHQPLLVNVLDKLARGETKGDVSRTTLPYCGTEAPPGKFSVVIVFVVGGITFEEALKVADINAGRLQIGRGSGGAGGGGAGGAAPPPFKVVLGGTTIHSSKNFLAELQTFSQAAVQMGGGGGGM